MWASPHTGVGSPRLWISPDAPHTCLALVTCSVTGVGPPRLWISPDGPHTCLYTLDYSIHRPLSILLFTVVACECPCHFPVVLLKIVFGEQLSAYSFLVFVQIYIVLCFFYVFAVRQALFFGLDPLCASSLFVAPLSTLFL
jgi:hypothetical protein